MAPVWFQGRGGQQEILQSGLSAVLLAKACEGLGGWLGNLGAAGY